MATALLVGCSDGGTNRESADPASPPTTVACDLLDAEPEFLVVQEQPATMAARWIVVIGDTAAADERSDQLIDRLAIDPADAEPLGVGMRLGGEPPQRIIEVSTMRDVEDLDAALSELEAEGLLAGDLVAVVDPDTCDLPAAPSDVTVFLEAGYADGGSGSGTVSYRDHEGLHEVGEVALPWTSAPLVVPAGTTVVVRLEAVPREETDLQCSILASQVHAESSPTGECQAEQTLSSTG